MVKRLSISFTDYIYEQYLQSAKINRSKYIEEMFVKGVNSELGEYQGAQTKAIFAIKQVREKEELISRLQKELASVKSRVMTQEKRQAIKDAKARNRAMDITGRKMILETLEEGDLR